MKPETKKLLSSWFEDSTIRQLKNFNSKNKIWLIFWATVTIGTFGGFIWQSIAVVKNYLKVSLFLN